MKFALIILTTFFASLSFAVQDELICEESLKISNGPSGPKLNPADLLPSKMQKNCDLTKPFSHTTDADYSSYCCIKAQVR